jgi:hypothetical protein
MHFHFFRPSITDHSRLLSLSLTPWTNRQSRPGRNAAAVINSKSPVLGYGSCPYSMLRTPNKAERREATHQSSSLQPAPRVSLLAFLPCKYSHGCLVAQTYISDCPDTRVFWWCHFLVYGRHYWYRSNAPIDSAHTSALLTAQHMTHRRFTLVSTFELKHKHQTDLCTTSWSTIWTQNKYMQLNNIKLWFMIVLLLKQ